MASHYNRYDCYICHESIYPDDISYGINEDSKTGFRVTVLSKPSNEEYEFAIHTRCMSKFIERKMREKNE